MNDVLTRISAWWLRAAPQRVELSVFWARHLGRPAWIAIASLIGVAIVCWQINPVLAREHARLVSRQASVATLAPERAFDPVAAGIPTLQELPSERQRGHDLEALVNAAQRNGLGLDRADYALANAGSADVLRLSATLPLTGTYASLRRYLADVLNELPHSALESLQIERANAKATQLQATARLMLYYRAEQP